LFAIFVSGTFVSGTALAQTSTLASWDAPPRSSITTAPDGGQTDSVMQRLSQSLSPEMRDGFNLFLYVDKAGDGPFAQQMYVFQKSADGGLVMLYDWPVSTGREAVEIDPHGRQESSVTPRGYFELDPKRLYVDHSSSQWDEAMPYAMFFSWKPDGQHETGLAIHGTPEENVGALGSRASAGCIRLSIENARLLFDMVQTGYKGPTPEIAYLDGDSPVSSEGLLLHDAQGQLELADGYSVLVVVDDFAGDSRMSALTATPGS